MSCVRDIKRAKRAEEEEEERRKKERRWLVRRRLICSDMQRTLETAGTAVRLRQGGIG